MFLHNLKYELLAALRVKAFIFWLLIFPMALGLFFKTAFIGIYEKNDMFSTVPCAVVLAEDNEALRTVVKSIESDEKPLFKASFVTDEEAKELLRKEEIEGIIYSEGGRLKLTVAGEGMNETLLKAFCDQYNANADVLTSTAVSDPAKLGEISEILMQEITTVKDNKLVNGNTDYYVEYFYNLIAMVALFGAQIGMTITINNQANLSALGARKNCSPTPKSVSVAASLVSRFAVQTLTMIVCVTFQHFVLGIDFGEHLLLVYLAAILAGILGVSLGFAVGSVGKGSRSTKEGITTAAIMFCCFLSGLMAANMKSILKEHVPFVNKINPAAVISDCFHCLNIYDNYDRFIEKLIVMAAMTFVFAFIGFILTRRRKYASL